MTHRDLDHDRRLLELVERRRAVKHPLEGIDGLRHDDVLLDDVRESAPLRERHRGPRSRDGGARDGWKEAGPRRAGELERVDPYIVTGWSERRCASGAFRSC